MRHLDNTLPLLCGTTKDGAAFGPLPPEQLKSHPDVQPETFVWREGLPSWLPLNEVEELRAVNTAVVLPSNPDPVFTPSPVESSRSIATESCSSCSKEFPTYLMTLVPDKWICIECRPYWEQRVREAVDWRKDPQNNIGGLGARTYGYVVENIIWGIVYVVLLGVFALITSPGSGESPDRMTAMIGVFIVFFATLIIKTIADTVMTVMNGSTMGHRTTGLKVVDINGKKPGYITACLRSAINTLCILFPPIFISVLIDAESRAPVDFILGTRVVYNRK